MDLAQKLQLTTGHGITVVAAPANLEGSLDLPAAAPSDASHALLVFVADRAALEVHRGAIVRSALDDRLTWVAYPKGGQLGTDLNRDSLAALVAESGAKPVRQISLDEVWSALRFRPG
jgi:hypothetical protein